eukprot:jgi/Botrbrau1/17045/Bobra.49_2s0101.1
MYTVTYTCRRLLIPLQPLVTESHHIGYTINGREKMKSMYCTISSITFLHCIDHKNRSSHSNHHLTMLCLFFQQYPFAVLMIV